MQTSIPRPNAEQQELIRAAMEIEHLTSQGAWIVHAACMYAEQVIRQKKEAENPPQQSTEFSAFHPQPSE